MSTAPRVPDIPDVSRVPDSIRETIYRLDGPLRWALGENHELADLAGLRPGGRALDVGAGTGYLTLTLAKRVGRDGLVAAVDSAPELLAVLAAKAEKANLSPPIRCVRGSALALQFPDDEFDAVCSSYLLHELCEGAPHALAEMHRVLRPGGRLVLADYRRIEDIPRRREIEAWYAAQKDAVGPDEVHLRFALGDIERMLVGTGFEQIEVATWKEFHLHARARK
jgi:ubiquinone/menaquinone biosynthesis C-methylase UbiE